MIKFTPNEKMSLLNEVNNLQQAVNSQTPQQAIESVKIAQGKLSNTFSKLGDVYQNGLKLAYESGVTNAASRLKAFEASGAEQSDMEAKHIKEPLEAYIEYATDTIKEII